MKNVVVMIKQDNTDALLMLGRYASEAEALEDCVECKVTIYLTTKTINGVVFYGTAE